MHQFDNLISRVGWIVKKRSGDMKKILILIVVFTLSLGVGALVLVAERGRILTAPKQEEPSVTGASCPMASKRLEACEEQQAEELEAGAIRGEWVTSGGATDPYYLRREECMAQYHEECKTEAQQATQEKAVGALGTPTQELEALEDIQAVQDY